MSALHETSQDFASNIKKKRYSVSAIPRPTSGTSRRVTPTRTLTHSQTTQFLTPLVPESHQTATTPQTAIKTPPPSSWKTPHSSLPRSDSLLPYLHRQERDLSGVQQQLQLRQYSSRSLSGPEAISSIENPSAISESSSLASHTTNTVSPSKSAVVPSRQLLKPLPPPLPRSQTTGYIQSLHLLTSPSVGSKSRLADDQAPSPAKVDVIDALLESRMTTAEINLLNQVQDEAAANTARQRIVFQARQHKRGLPPHASASATPPVRRNRHEAIINLSLNDIANTKRLEDQRSKSASKRLLFINSKLANAHCSDTILSTPTSITSVSSRCPDEEWVPNSKLVYFSEQTPYWIGRYMSVCSRLRTAELENLRTPSSPASPVLLAVARDINIEPDDDTLRMNLALRELRAYCRTTEALQSFEVFEAGLKKKIASSNVAVASNSENVKNGEVTKKRWYLGSSKSSLLLPLDLQPSHIEQAKIETRRMSAKLTKDSAVAPNGAFLTKSKTTGNLASLVPRTLSKLPLPSISQRLDNEKQIALTEHRHGARQRSPQITAYALQAREEKACQRVLEIQRRISEPTVNDVQIEKSSKRQKPASQNANTGAASTNYTKLDAYAEVGYGTTYAALETGHGLPPPAPPAKDSEPRAMIEIVNGEKVLRSRSKTERQTSGEYVKNLLGAGFREVKRMGKRVGSMGWSGVADDLSSEGMLGPR